MKKTLLSLFVMVALLSCNTDGAKIKPNNTIDLKSDELDIVNQRMDFYNNHDFESFIKLYAEDVEVYTYPDRLLGTGKDNISSIFKPKFADKLIQVEIISQMYNGNHVINHEIVTENGVDSKYVSIYEVENGLIKSVRFVRDK